MCYCVSAPLSVHLGEMYCQPKISNHPLLLIFFNHAHSVISRYIMNNMHPCINVEALLQHNTSIRIQRKWISEQLWHSACFVRQRNVIPNTIIHIVVTCNPFLYWIAAVICNVLTRGGVPQTVGNNVCILNTPLSLLHARILDREEYRSNMIFAKLDDYSNHWLCFPGH